MSPLPDLPVNADAVSADAIALLREDFGPGAFEDYMRLLRGSLSGRLARLGRKGQDAAAIGFEAHAIAGSAGIVGALRLVDAALDLERICREPGDPHEIAHRVSRVVQLGGEVCAHPEICAVGRDAVAA